MSGECSFRRGSLRDLEDLLRIAVACAETPRWNESVWQGLLAGAGEVSRVVIVAERGGAVTGFIVVGCTAGVAEIESVAVLAEFRRMGVGRGLCTEAIRWARGGGAEAVQLEVRASSAGAIALYAGLGFVEQGRRRGYYRDPADDAVLMAMELVG